MSRPDRRIPSLDGLRALSISLVLLGHLRGTAGLPPSANQALLAAWRIGDLANFGVRVFFVISGFLITGILLRELDASGNISLRRFYSRRAWRIFPPYVAFLVVVATLVAGRQIALRPNDLVHAATYTMNYHQDRSWWVGHLWSLSVEEQFYLLWPLTLVLLGRRRGMLAALAFVIIAPVARLLPVQLWHSTAGVGETFGTVGDSIAAGCLLAGCREALWAREWYRRLLSSQAIVAAGVVVSFLLQHWYRPSLLIGMTAANLAIALAVDHCVRFPSRPFGRLLNARPIAYVGTLSYSIYLWQQPFINRTDDRLLTHMPLNLVGAATAALLSYYLIERPALRIRGGSASQPAAGPLPAVPASEPVAP